MIPARPRQWALAHVMTLFAGAVWLSYLGRAQWFFYDEWDVVGNHTLGLFQPHNEHWSTLPHLAYSALYAAFGLRTYLPYLVVVVLLHTAVVHMLWRAMRRQGTRPWLATSLAAAFMVLGSGAENLDWAWQMGFVGAVLSGLLALELATAPAPTRRRDGLVVAALVAGLMCSGIGVTMVLVTGLGAWAARGWRRALALVAAPAVMFAAWYAVAGHTGGRHYSAPTLPGSAAFVAAGLSATVELGYRVPGVGVVLAVLAVAWALRRLRHGTRPHPQAAAGVLGALALFILISLGRIQYGVDSATQGRYVYVASALLLPAAAVALDGLAARGKATGAVAAIVVTAAVGHNAAGLVAAEAEHAAVSARTRAAVMAALPGLSAAGLNSTARPDPRDAPTLTLRRLAAFRAEGSLPEH